MLVTSMLVLKENGKKIRLYNDIKGKLDGKTFTSPAQLSEKLSESINNDLAKIGVHVVGLTERNLPDEFFPNDGLLYNSDFGRYISKYRELFSAETIGILKECYGDNWDYSDKYYCLCIGNSIVECARIDITAISNDLRNKLSKLEDLVGSGDGENSYINSWVEVTRYRAKRPSISYLGEIINEYGLNIKQAKLLLSVLGNQFE